MEENEEKVGTAQNEEAKTNETVEEKVGEVVGNDGFSEKDKEDNKMMALLSYIGFLALVPYFMEKDSEWVRYHALQGINLLILELIIYAVGFVPLIGWIVSGVCSFISIILSIIGIINVCNGEAKELPIVSNFKFIKQ